MGKLFPVKGMELLSYSLGSKNRNIIFRNHFTMEDDVDPELLKEAVCVVREYFWPLRMSLVVHKGSLMHEEIQNEPPVFHRENRSYTLGTEDTNGYMYYVLYQDKEIDFFICHGLSDATALSVCIWFILKVYCSLKYPGHENFDVDSEYRKLNIWETHNPYEEFEGKDKTQLALADYQKGFTIPGGSDYSVYDVVNIDIPLEQAMKVIKRIGVTPITFFTALFDRAIRESCAVGDAPILSFITMDLRRLLGKFPLAGYTGTAAMTYLPEYDSLDIEELCRRFHDDLESQRDVDTQNAMIKMNLYMTKLMELKFLPLGVRLKMLSLILEKGEQLGTYAATNVGKFTLPDEKVVSLRAFATGLTQTYLGIISTGDTMNVSFTYYLHEKRIIDRFMDLLNSEGIETEYYIERYSEPTFFDFSKLRRV